MGAPSPLMLQECQQVLSVPIATHPLITLPEGLHMTPEAEQAHASGTHST